MRKTILICDRCKKEAKWLYSMPRLEIDGLNLSTYVSKKDLCEDCARDLRRFVDGFCDAKTLEDEKNEGKDSL